MGIRFYCPECQNRLHVKSFLAGKRGVCPKCGAKVDIPTESELADDEKELDASPAVQPAARETGQHVSAPTATLETKTRPRTNAQTTVPAAGAPKKEFSTPPISAKFPSETPQPVGQTAAPKHAPSKPAPSKPATSKPASSTRQPVVPGGTPMDALQEAPQSVWYVRPPSGGQFGPARAEVMQRWIDEGRVTSDSYVWRDGWPDWRLASDALPSLAGPAPQATTAASARPATSPTAIVPAQSIPPTTAATLLRYQKKKRSRRGIWTAAVVLLSVLAMVLIVLLVLVLRRT
jgi:hypothetical protein